MKKLLSNQFVVWAIVGFSTIALDFVIFLFTHSVTHSVPISNFISVILSSIYNFFLHRLRTFQNTTHFREQASKYCIYQFLIWLLGTKLILIFIHLGVSLETAKLLPLLIIAPINFVSLKYFVYKE